MQNDVYTIKNLFSITRTMQQSWITILYVCVTSSICKDLVQDSYCCLSVNQLLSVSLKKVAILLVSCVKMLVYYVSHSICG